MDTDLRHVQVHDANLVSFLDDLPRVLSCAVVLCRFRDDLIACKLGRQVSDLTDSDFDNRTPRHFKAKIMYYF